MKKKVKISMVLWGLIMILGAIGLVGCSSGEKEEYVEENVYQGFIRSVEPSFGKLYIKVTYCPANTGTDMPRVKDELSISLADFPNMDFKAQQKLSFHIISAEQLMNAMYQDYSNWKCKIIILKIK